MKVDASINGKLRGVAAETQRLEAMGYDGVRVVRA